MPRFKNIPLRSNNWQKIVSCLCIDNVVMLSMQMCFLIMILYSQVSNATSIIRTGDHSSKVANDNYGYIRTVYQPRPRYHGMYKRQNIEV